MRLGAAYIVFDGIELLEHSISQIRQSVDYVVVVYQTTSWFGKPILQEDIFTLERLKSSGLIDEFLLFKDFYPLSPNSSQLVMQSKTYETKKRQFGMQYCLRNGCTHFLCMDVDEFYESTQFKTAKDFIDTKDYAISACKFINYVNLPVYHRGYGSHYVPFICKINSSTKLGREFFVRVDPTRGVNNGLSGSYTFSTSDLTMHHMESIRKNLLRKYESTTRFIFDRQHTTDLINSIKAVNDVKMTVNFKKIIYPAVGQVSLSKVDNKFKIPYLSW